MNYCVYSHSGVLEVDLLVKIMNLASAAFFRNTEQYSICFVADSKEECLKRVEDMNRVKEVI